MQSHDGKDKPKTQHEHDHRVNAQPRALISIKLHHGSRRATGTSRSGRGRSRISEGFLVVGSGTTADRGSWTAWGSRGGGTVHSSSGAGARWVAGLCAFIAGVRA